ncbi:hypothetical protein CBS101457_000483 [Exobasidium rhododendri]|nr:hypothetical protein CBS101457_000483 [Exobasidium rhododendri]
MSPVRASSSSRSALVSTSSSARLSRSTLQQRILTENAYCSTLSDLIRRDFFPHLDRLEAENAYLDALTHADEADGEVRLEKAVRRLVGQEVRAGIVPPTPRQGDGIRSRRRYETPSSTPGSILDDDTPRIGFKGRGGWDPTPLPRSDAGDTIAEVSGDELDNMDDSPSIEGLTLSSFQALYTSEDNASFLDILQANELKRKEAYRWAYEAERKANEKRQRSLLFSQLQAKAGFQSSLEKAPPDVRRRLDSGLQLQMITSNGEVGKRQHAITKEEEKLPLVGVAEISPAEDEARSLQSWPHRARNALFYGPDANRSTVSQRTSSLPLYKKSVTQGPTSIFDEETPQDRAPGINFDNTRLPDDDDEEEGSRGSETPRSSRIDAAIGGWADSSSSAAGPSSEVGDRSNSSVPSSPRVAGYSFVSPLPSPKPGDLGEERVRQLMTWGTVIGTPKAIGQSRAGGDQEDQYDGSFRIPPTPNRDLLARRLADKSESRASKRSSATPAKTSNKRRNRMDLSPAAQMLFDRTTRGSIGSSSLGSTLLTGRGRREEANNRIRRERWTPSPSPRG